MKSRKIQILEFISDKIEGGDSKRDVMCIRFGHPTKKNELVRGSPWAGSHDWSWNFRGSPWGAHRRGERRGRGRGRGGTAMGKVGRAHGEGEIYRRGVRHGTRPSCSSVRSCCLRAVLFVRKKEEREKKKKRKEKKRNKYGKFSKLKIFQGEK
jgi:hypothetical protein